MRLFISIAFNFSFNRRKHRQLTIMSASKSDIIEEEGETCVLYIRLCFPEGGLFTPSQSVIEHIYFDKARPGYLFRSLGDNDTVHEMTLKNFFIRDWGLDGFDCETFSALCVELLNKIERYNGSTTINQHALARLKDNAKVPIFKFFEKHADTYIVPNNAPSVDIITEVKWFYKHYLNSKGKGIVPCSN